VSALVNMNEAGLKMLLSELVALKRTRDREAESLVEQVSNAETALNKHHRITGVIDQQIEFVNWRLQLIEAQKAVATPEQPE
jgi:hypothetical protein